MNQVECLGLPKSARCQRVNPRAPSLRRAPRAMLGTNQASNKCQSILLNISLLLDCIWSDLPCSVKHFLSHEVRRLMRNLCLSTNLLLTSCSHPPGKQVSNGCFVLFLSTLWKTLIFLAPALPSPLHSSLNVGRVFYFGLSFQGCCLLIRGQAALIVSYFSLGWKVLLWC